MGENNEVYKFTLKKMFIHLSTILRHKHYVFINCYKCGIPWQGIIHDLSKFSPPEFWLNVKYVKPGISPIDVQKEVIGFSFAWQHHKGHNPHHYEFWMDKFDNGCYVTRMPYKYMVECLCDLLAAGKAYNPKGFNYISEFKWWKKQRVIRNMHPNNIKFLDCIFTILYDLEINDLRHNNEKVHYIGDKVYTLKSINDVLNKKFLKDLYNDIESNSSYEKQIKIENLRKWE